MGGEQCLPSHWSQKWDSREMLGPAPMLSQCAPESRQGMTEAPLPRSPLHQRLWNVHSVFRRLWPLQKPLVFNRLHWSNTNALLMKNGCMSMARCCGLAPAIPFLSRLQTGTLSSAGCGSRESPGQPAQGQNECLPAAGVLLQRHARQEGCCRGGGPASSGLL